MNHGPTFNYLLDASRSRPLTWLVAESVDQHVDVANRLKAQALEDRAGHGTALGNQHGRSEKDGFVPARA
jgi:hypothetical protein